MNTNTFEQVLGNEGLVRHLKNTVETGMVSHAYILSGAEGSGKKTLAGIFAKALECEGEGARPCGECASCRVFESGNHPDILYIRAQKTKALGVDEIREQAVEEASLTKYRYRYKIFIIEEADSMTAAAQNALLKTLEEPPPDCIFLLVSENPAALLPTVRSRCALLRTRELPSSLIASELVKRAGVKEELAGLCAEYSRGSLGRALALSTSEEFIAMREKVLALLQKIGRADLATVLSFAKELSVFKEAPDFLDMIVMWYRDLLVYTCLLEEKFILERDMLPEIKRQARLESVDGLTKKIDAVYEARQQIERNANFQLVMEVMLIKLKES